MSPPLSKPNNFTWSHSWYSSLSTNLYWINTARCLLAVFLPFELASRLLQQLSGIVVSDVTWQWVQVAGQQAIEQLKLQIQQLENGNSPQLESLDTTLEEMPWSLRGVTVPFRPSPKTPKGKIVWREVKIALLARLAKHQTKTKETVTRLHQRWLVALGIDALKPRLQLVALKQGITTAPQVVWFPMERTGFGDSINSALLTVLLASWISHAVQHL